MWRLISLLAGAESSMVFDRLFDYGRILEHGFDVVVVLAAQYPGRSRSGVGLLPQVSPEFPFRDVWLRVLVEPAIFELVPPLWLEQSEQGPEFHLVHLHGRGSEEQQFPGLPAEPVHHLEVLVRLPPCIVIYVPESRPVGLIRR